MIKNDFAVHCVRSARISKSLCTACSFFHENIDSCKYCSVVITVIKDSTK